VRVSQKQLEPNPTKKVKPYFRSSHSYMYTGRSGKDDKYEDFPIGTGYYGLIAYNRIEST